MKLSRLVKALALTVTISGALILQGCFEEHYVPAPAYGYGYGYGAPVYGGHVVYGDWDEHHIWHDRDWWVANRRPWVEQHHREWLAARPSPRDMYNHPG